MKVKTDLKGGNWLNTLQSQAGQVVNQATGFVTKADKQASGLVNQATRTTQSLWNSLTGWLG